MATFSGVRRALFRLAMAAALAVALLALSTNVAWACLCDASTPRDAMANADAVFTGVARGRITPERFGFEERVEFVVETVYKGEVPSRWSVSVDATSCAYVFTDGVRYTVFAVAGRTSLCMGNVQGAIDPAAYGAHPIALYPSGQLIDLGRDTDRFALAAILLVGISAVVAIRLRRAKSV
jgi:hypothetical protein